MTTTANLPQKFLLRDKTIVKDYLEKLNKSKTMKPSIRYWQIVYRNNTRQVELLIKSLC